MAKYIVSVTRTLVVEADSEGEATTMSLYATHYPDQLTGIECIEYEARLLFNQNEISKKSEDWSEGPSN